MGRVTCKCNNTLGNTGSGCVSIFDVVRRIILVPYFNDAGTVNGILLSTVTGASFLDNAYFADLVNQPDASKRWFPLPEVKNVASERGDDETESFDDNSKVFITQGVREVKLLIVGRNVSPTFLGKVKQARCTPVGFYEVDKDGNLLGSISKDGLYLNPIRIGDDTLSAKWVPTADKTSQKMMVNFEVHTDENDEDLQQITSNEMTADLLLLKGLLDVNVVFSAMTFNGFTMKLTTDFGTALTKTPVEGLLAADMALYNVTDGSAMAITGTGSAFTETVPGTYVIEYSTATQPTAGDVIRNTITKDGYDFTNVTNTTFVTA